MGYCGNGKSIHFLICSYSTQVVLYKLKMVSSEEESDVKPYVSVEWDVDMEIQLFYAMAYYKPVGINKHFHMAGIWEKLSDSIPKPVTTHDIWKHLGCLYDLSMLDETEPIPFPNEEIPFCLPESEFGTLMKQKCKDLIPGEDSEGNLLILILKTQYGYIRPIQNL